MRWSFLVNAPRMMGSRAAPFDLIVCGSFRVAWFDRTSLIDHFRLQVDGPKGTAIWTDNLRQDARAVEIMLAWCGAVVVLAGVDQAGLFSKQRSV